MHPEYVCRNVTLDYEPKDFFNEAPTDLIESILEAVKHDRPDPTAYRLPIMTDSVKHHSVRSTISGNFLALDTGIRIHMRRGVSAGIRLNQKLESAGIYCLNRAVTSSYNNADLPLYVSATRATAPFSMDDTEVFAYLYVSGESTVQDYVEDETRNIFIF